jgi:hypothetical protein
MALAPSRLEVRRAVERDHRLVERPLVGGLADERRGDLAVDVCHGLAHALAEVAPLVAVAQFERLALPVDAPEGTAARPDAPESSVTSTSTVGLPRESRISRP